MLARESLTISALGKKFQPARNQSVIFLCFFWKPLNESQHRSWTRTPFAQRHEQSAVFSFFFTTTTTDREAIYQGAVQKWQICFCFSFLRPSSQSLHEQSFSHRPSPELLPLRHGPLPFFLHVAKQKPSPFAFTRLWPLVISSNEVVLTWRVIQLFCLAKFQQRCVFTASLCQTVCLNARNFHMSRVFLSFSQLDKKQLHNYVLSKHFIWPR